MRPPNLLLDSGFAGEGPRPGMTVVFATVTPCVIWCIICLNDPFGSAAMNVKPDIQNAKPVDDRRARVTSDAGGKDWDSTWGHVLST